MPFADNNGTRIYYEVMGSGSPLVLETGFAQTLNDWHQMGYSEELSKEYKLILMDARGRGKSDKPQDISSYDLRLLVYDIVSILDNLKIDKANFLGYSMGGKIGWFIPLYAPERFQSLLLGGAAYPLQPDGSDKVMASPIASMLEEALEKAPKEPMEYIIKKMENSSGRPLPAIRREELLSLDARALLASRQAYAQAIIPKPDDYLPGISLHCLIFIGENDPGYLSARQCASMVPNATFISFPDIGHGDAIGRKDLVIPAILKFLS
jgi:pimeloyl-ACP methyl ester carboxylesterase